MSCRAGGRQHDVVERQRQPSGLASSDSGGVEGLGRKCHWTVRLAAIMISVASPFPILVSAVVMANASTAFFTARVPGHMTRDVVNELALYLVISGVLVFIFGVAPIVLAWFACRGHRAAFVALTILGPLFL